jgi:RNA polymerase sigma-70 factor (ECF subfamily)
MDRTEWDSRRALRGKLMERVQQGDADAYRALLDEVGPALRGFLARRTRDVADLQDVYQDTFLALHRARHTYEPGRSFDAWFFGIARHVAVTHFRRSAARTRREVLGDGPASAVAGAEDGLEWRLRRALDRLPPAQKEALQLLRIRGLTADEAAEAANTTAGAIKVRAHRAFKTLRRLLVERA